MKTALLAAIVALTATSACAHSGKLYPGHGHGHPHELGHHHDGHTHGGHVYVAPPVIVCDYYTESYRNGPYIWYNTYDCHGNLVNSWSEWAPVYHWHYNYHRH